MIGTPHTPSDFFFLGIVIEVCTLGIFIWHGRLNYPLIFLGLFCCIWAGIEAKWLSNRRKRPAVNSEAKRMRFRTLLIAVTMVAIVLGLAV